MTAPIDPPAPIRPQRRTPVAAVSQHERRTVSSFVEFLPGVPDLLVDIGAIDRCAVTAEGAVPRRDGIVEPADFEEQLPVMFLDDGVDRQLLGGAPQILLGEVKLAGLEVGPAQTVE